LGATVSRCLALDWLTRNNNLTPHDVLTAKAPPSRRKRQRINEKHLKKTVALARKRGLTSSFYAYGRIYLTTYNMMRPAGTPG